MRKLYNDPKDSMQIKIIENDRFVHRGSKACAWGPRKRALLGGMCAGDISVV